MAEETAGGAAAPEEAPFTEGGMLSASEEMEKLKAELDEPDGEAAEGVAAPARGADGKFLPNGAAAPPKPKGVQGRIDELTREKHDAERKAADAEAKRDAAQRELAELKKAGAPKADVSAAQKAVETAAAGADDAAQRAWDAANPEPKLEEFPDDPNKYYKAQARWEVKRELGATARAEVAKQAALTEAKEARTRMEAWESKVAKARESHADWDEVTQAKISLFAVAWDAIDTSDLAAEIAYHLAGHQEECVRIAALGAAAQAREIGKIEARLAAERDTSTAKSPNEDEPAEATPRAGSRAPEPIRPVRPRDRVEVDPEKLPQDQFEDWLDAKMKANRRKR